MSCFSVISSSLSWEEVFEKFIEDENSRANKTPRAVKLDQIAIATYLSENVVVSSQELGLNSEVEKQQILLTMPVIIMKSRELELFVNIHEFALTPNFFEAFIYSEKTVDSKGDKKDNDTKVQSKNRENKQEAHEKRGQPSLVTKFPDIIDKTKEFIKQHGFAAQHRRRTSTGYSSCVTIAQVRDHLMKEIPGLKDHMEYHYRLSDGCSMPPLSRECVVQGIRIISL